MWTLWTSAALCRPFPRHPIIVSVAFASVHFHFCRSQRGQLKRCANPLDICSVASALSTTSDHCLCRCCFTTCPFLSILTRTLKALCRLSATSDHLALSPLLQYIFRSIHLRKEIDMTASSGSPAAIAVSPVSQPEQAMENIGQTAQAITLHSIFQLEQARDNSMQTIGRASQVDQISNHDSPTRTLDWPLPATRLIPRPRTAQPTSKTSQRIRRVNKDGERQTHSSWDRDQADEPHLSLPRNSPLSTERPQLGSDEIQAPIVFEPTVPALKYHAHLECITHPRLTQREYEQRVSAGE